MVKTFQGFLENRAAGVGPAKLQLTSVCGDPISQKRRNLNTPSATGESRAVTPRDTTRPTSPRSAARRRALRQNAHVRAPAGTDARWARRSHGNRGGGHAGGSVCFPLGPSTSLTLL